MDEQKYIKGFNHGYLLAIHEPELAAKIVSQKNDHNEYFKGFVSGKQEHDMEKLRSRLKTVSKENTPEKTKTIEKGKQK